jgi:hypothetical protein
MSPRAGRGFQGRGEQSRGNQGVSIQPSRSYPAWLTYNLLSEVQAMPSLRLSPRHAGVVSSIRNSPHRFVLFCAREQVYAERLT